MSVDALSELTAALARLAAAAKKKATEQGDERDVQTSGFEGVYTDVAACLKGASEATILEQLAVEADGRESRQGMVLADEPGSPTEECESGADEKCTTTPVCQRTLRRVGSSPNALSDVKVSKRRKSAVSVATAPTRSVRKSKACGSERRRAVAPTKISARKGRMTEKPGRESRRAAALATLAALGQEELYQTPDDDCSTGKAPLSDSGLSGRKGAKNSPGPRNSLVVQADSRSDREPSRCSPHRGTSRTSRTGRASYTKEDGRGNRRSKSRAADKLRSGFCKRPGARPVARPKPDGEVEDLSGTNATGAASPSAALPVGSSATGKRNRSSRDAGQGRGSEHGDRARIPRGSAGTAERAAKRAVERASKAEIGAGSKSKASVRKVKVRGKRAPPHDTGSGDEAPPKKRAKRRKRSRSSAAVAEKALAEVVSLADASTRTPSSQDEKTPSPTPDCVKDTVSQRSTETAGKPVFPAKLKPRNSLDIQPPSKLKLLPRSSLRAERVVTIAAGTRGGGSVGWSPARWGSERCRTSCDPSREGPHAAWDNDGFFVIYKPPGWTATTTSNRGEQRRKIQSWLLETYGESHPYLLTDTLQAGIVHRLDIQTTGPMVVAGRPDTYHDLCCSLARQVWYKEYVTLIHGALPPGRSQGCLTYRLQVPRRWGAKLWRTEVCASGLPAETRYQALRSYSRTLDSGVVRYYTLVRVRLITGRTHQIRVHFRELARRLEMDVCGLVGDHIYLPRAQLAEDLRFCERIFLHERRLRFPHPNPSKGPLNVVCPLPPDLMRALGALDLERKVPGALKCSASRAPAAAPAEADAAAPPSPWRPPVQDD